MKKSLFIFLCACMMVLHMPMKLHAQAVETVSISGYFNDQEALEAIDYVNEERASYGINTLLKDEDLMETARQRAAEIAIDFDYAHYRPNGTSFKTTGNKVVSEIICAGVNDFDAYEAYETWLYSSSHHTEYMKGSYNLAGAARFTQGSGVYWVMHFGTNVQNPIEKVNGEEYLTKQVELIPELLPIYNSNISLAGGESTTLSMYGSNTSFSFSTYEIEYTEFEMTSSDESVVKIDDKGNIYGLKAGNSTVTIKGNTFTQAINVSVYGNNSVKYILNNGENDPYAATNYDGTLELKAPQRKGYIFKGWYLDDNKTKVQELTGGNHSVYAKWTKAQVKQMQMPKVRSTASSNRLIVQYKDMKHADGYQIYYSTTKDFENVKKVLTKKGTYFTPKLKEGITYYVKVRAYRNDSTGQRIYGEFSPIVKTKIK